MKTLTQIANELNVSKTAVRKKVEQSDLWNKLHKDGNRYVVDEELENIIKSMFSQTQKTKTKTKTKTETETESNKVLVSLLQRELEIKNEQISQLQKLLDQEQQLRMVSETKLLQLEEKENKKKWWKIW